jgi:hypothetical protein
MWSVAGMAIIAVGLMAYDLLYPSRLGPEQHIPFSHRVHVHDKKISCYLCHGGARSSESAGVPEVATCMLCHSKIIIAYPAIRHLREHYFDSMSIDWDRVTRVPDYVYFNHAMHIRRGIDCGRCHGDVEAMDRVKLPGTLTMGFCIRCHRAENASRDCLTCHR